MHFGVKTKTLNRAGKRNQERFPDTFCFQLSEQEASRCQIGTSMQIPDIRGGRTCLPYAFTIQGRIC
ncbi:MAG: ORF6N domain-containing protein [Erysipelotrichaceae bacterium]|nr:ORF6N domain-containing protein [Erysipelotrichaceae bacterium]